MLQWLRHALHPSLPRPVFIIGSGRSGTHWLAKSLQGHPQIFITVEEQPMFQLSQQMALNTSLQEGLFDLLVSSYKQKLNGRPEKIYVDKSHPNIWLAERLKGAFPESLFLGIERNPYATVASMLRHRGVLGWHERWREFPLPNAFLGITEDMAEHYDAIPLAAKCAMRWLAHSRRMNEVKASIGQDLLLISYEKFQLSTQATNDKLKMFLGLQSSLQVPNAKKDSLYHWQNQLSSEQIHQIGTVIGDFPGSID